jgi:hypothetical protein
MSTKLLLYLRQTFSLVHSEHFVSICLTFPRRFLNNKLTECLYLAKYGSKKFIWSLANGERNVQNGREEMFSIGEQKFGSKFAEAPN